MKKRGTVRKIKDKRKKKPRKKPRKETKKKLFRNRPKAGNGCLEHCDKLIGKCEDCGNKYVFGPGGKIIGEIIDGGPKAPQGSHMERSLRSSVSARSNMSSVRRRNHRTQ